MYQGFFLPVCVPQMSIIVLHLLLLLHSLFPKVLPELKEFEIKGYAQGTSFQIKYYSTDSLDRRHIYNVFNYLDSNFSIYNTNSVVSAFNRSSQGLRVDPGFAHLISRAVELAEITGGAFDITIRPVLAAWGFNDRVVKASPSKIRLKNALKLLGSDKLLLKGDSLLKLKENAQIDLDGVAQGYSVDLIADLLLKNGIHDFMVELGGEVRTSGLKFGFQDWIIALGDQSYTIGNQVKSVKIKINGLAVTTSGNMSKFVRYGKRYFSHIIDPKSGYPVNNGVISVTVIAENATTADGLDNALMVLGVKEGLQWLEQHPGWEAYYTYVKENGSISHASTPGFSTYIIDNQ